MNNAKMFSLLIDNSTIAGAGRALYEPSPDLSDCRSLMHLITTTLFCEQIYIDGSSRVMPIRLYNSSIDADETTAPLPVIWTWEKRYPALADFCKIIDGFWQRVYNFDKRRIVDFVLRVLSESGDDEINRLDMELVPSIYLSKKYFDLDWLNENKSIIEAETGIELSDKAFSVLLYAWRGVYYYELSKLLDVTYFAHPQRSKFIEPFMVPGNSLYDYDKTALVFLSKAICTPAYKLAQTHAVEKAQDFAISLFPFAEYVLGNCRSGSRQEIIDRTVALRQSDEIEELRSFLKDYDTAYRSNNLLSLKRYQQEINRTMTNFERRHGLETLQLKIVPRLPLDAIELQGFNEISPNVPLPGFLFTEIFQKPYMSWMWDLSRGLLEGGSQLDRIPYLRPLESKTRAIEWILMESGGRQVPHTGTILKGHVAGPGENNLYEYESYEDLLSASSRPANPLPSPSETSLRTQKDFEEMDFVFHMKEEAEKRKLTKDEVGRLRTIFAHGDERTKMNASWSIEMSGDPEATRELLEWENKYIRQQMNLGYDDDDCP